VSSTDKPEFQFDLTGGQLALDLANTVSRRGNPERRREHLDRYSDVISFLRQEKVLSPEQASQLRDYAQHHTPEARRSFARIIQLREATYAVFAAISQHKAVPAGDLKLINDFAAEAWQHRRLKSMNGSYGWEWIHTKCPLDRFQWLMVQAAIELLTSDELKIVRFCEAPDCEWLFLDHSRNRSRRWCDMKSCGNRAKARRHYERTHG
jgi:predicted RNA-binding Zn ribbon-like protein